MTTADLDFGTTTYKAYYTCTALLLLKILCMVPLRARFLNWKKGFFISELYSFLDGLKGRNEHPNAEKARRAHLNDLLNILLFISTGCWFCALNPSPVFAVSLFIIYTIARFVHTYDNVIHAVKHPGGLVSTATGLVITAYMAIYIVLSLKD